MKTIASSIARGILSNASIKEESSNKVGWMIERSSSMTMLKVLIPLRGINYEQIY